MYNITYGNLEDALLALGFTVSTGVGEYGAHYIAFDNTDCDAWIVVPEAPREELLRPIDLRMAERTVVWKGIADSKKFHKLLGTQDSRVPARAA